MASSSRESGLNRSTSGGGEAVGGEDAAQMEIDDNNGQNIKEGDEMDMTQFRAMTKRFTSMMEKQLNLVPNVLVTSEDVKGCEDMDILKTKCLNLLQKEQFLEFKIEFADFQHRLNRIAYGKMQDERHTQALEGQKEAIFAQIMQILEAEFSCSVCNEIFINPFVIQCGHTYCCHCITEWKKEKPDCPICRKFLVYSSGSKHVEMENFVNKMISLFPQETQDKRKDLIVERQEQVREAANRPPAARRTAASNFERNVEAIQERIANQIRARPNHRFFSVGGSDYEDEDEVVALVEPVRQELDNLETMLFGTDGVVSAAVDASAAAINTRAGRRAWESRNNPTTAAAGDSTTSRRTMPLSFLNHRFLQAAIQAPSVPTSSTLHVDVQEGAGGGGGSIARAREGQGGQGGVVDVEGEGSSLNRMMELSDRINRSRQSRESTIAQAIAGIASSSLLSTGQQGDQVGAEGAQGQGEVEGSNLESAQGEGAGDNAVASTSGTGRNQSGQVARGSRRRPFFCIGRLNRDSSGGLTIGNETVALRDEEEGRPERDGERRRHSVLGRVSDPVISNRRRRNHNAFRRLEERVQTYLDESRANGTAEVTTAASPVRVSGIRARGASSNIGSTMAAVFPGGDGGEVATTSSRAAASANAATGASTAAATATPSNAVATRPRIYYDEEWDEPAAAVTYSRRVESNNNEEETPTPASPRQRGAVPRRRAARPLTPTPPGSPVPPAVATVAPTSPDYRHPSQREEMRGMNFTVEDPTTEWSSIVLRTTRRSVSPSSSRLRIVSSPYLLSSGDSSGDPLSDSDS